MISENEITQPPGTRVLHGLPAVSQHHGQLVDCNHASAANAEVVEEEIDIGGTTVSKGKIMKVLARFCVLMLIVCPGLARNTETHTAEIRNVRVLSDGDNVRVEVKLSGSVSSKVVVASNPDRLVLELPNTAAGTVRPRIAVNQDGVKGVRIAKTVY
jgi:hypothetical protein